MLSPVKAIVPGWQFETVTWSHSDAQPDSCGHRGTDHVNVSVSVVGTKGGSVQCFFNGTERELIQNPPCQ